jgi:predicted Zn-dependent protease
MSLSPMKYFAAVAPICALLFLTGCSQSPQKLIATANKYNARHKYKEASILYQKAILKDKTNAEAYYREGLNRLDDHDPVNAVKYLRRAIDLNPNNIDAETKLAEVYLGAYASNPARFHAILPEITDLTKKILQHDPNSFDGLRLEALMALVNKNLDEALKDFARANELKPHSREVVGWYAQALNQAKKPEQAVSLIKDMLAHDSKWSPGYDFLFLQYAREGDKKKAEAVLREHVANDPHNPGAVIALANYLLADNRFDEAQTIMQSILADKSAFPRARALMGDFYVRAKKYDQALQQYRAGASEDSKDALFYQERVVRVELLDGQREEAMQLAKTLAQKNPDNLPVNETYASLLMNTGKESDITAAVATLKGLVQKHPDDPVLHMDLARGYFDTNEKDKSLNEAQEATQQELKQRAPRDEVLIPARIIEARIYEDRGQHSQALQTTDLILRSQPLNPDARLIRDRAWFATGQADQAQADLESLVQQYPRMNDARVVLGDVYASKKEFDKASAQYMDAWKSNPPDMRGFLGLQTVKVMQGKGAEAVEALQQLVDKNPDVLAFRYQLANFEAQTGMQTMQSNPSQGKTFLQEAADNYKQILKTTTNSTDVWLRLGMLQRALGQYDASLASFEQAGSADPHDAQAFLNEGVLLDHDLGKKKEAAAAYNKVLGIDPENAVALNNLAFIDAENDSNLDQAESFAERAKQKVPNSPVISDTLGYVYYRKNLNGEALRIFKQIVEQEPANPTFRLHLAMALLKQGNKQGAKEQAERALKSATQPEQQNQIRSFVNQIG